MLQVNCQRRNSGAEWRPARCLRYQGLHRGAAVRAGAAKPIMACGLEPKRRKVDHRAIDGVYGARFLKSLVENIENYAEFD